MRAATPLLVAASLLAVAQWLLFEPFTVPRRPFSEGAAPGESASDVARRIARARRPVILTDSPAADWAALREWTPERLAERLASLPPVGESNKSTFHYYDERAEMLHKLGLTARQLSLIHISEPTRPY